jgi:hypothetical protein
MNNQPEPLANNNQPIWSLVIRDMMDRHWVGVKTYGVPLQAANGRDALRDAYAEALDLCAYLRQAIEERDATAVPYGVRTAWSTEGMGDGR